MGLTFTSSAPLTLGVELELQLVRAHDHDLAHEAGDLIGRLAKKKVPGAVKPEVTLSMIELNSSIQPNHAGLLAELEAQRAAVREAAGVLNLRVAGGGAHPFHHWPERRVFPAQRFQDVVERYGYLAKQFTVFGQHIHVGCAGGDDAVYLIHMLTRHMPQFIALSAASPFYQGEDTSFQSSRLTAISAFPLSGHMPFVRDWPEFEEYFDTMRGFGIVAEHEGFLLGHPAQARVRHDRDPRLRHAAHRRARRAARGLRAGARRLLPRRAAARALAHASTW